MQPILSIKNISYSYHTMQAETCVLRDFSLDILPGEFISIVGPSGCGKSTLLSIISGLIKPDDGQITFNNVKKDVKQISVGYMLQHDQLFEWRTVWQNAILGPEINHCLTDDKKIKISERLKAYNLYDFKDCYPGQLSGGMRQRTALVRTLAMEPQLLLLDEPFSALDYQTRLSVSDDICTLIRNEKKTAVLVTHDLSEAISTADRVIVLSKRPASIKKIILLNFSDNGQNVTPLMRRNSPGFPSYFNMLWREMIDNG